MPDILAHLVFVLLYAFALRVYLYLRVHREAHRWHLVAVVVAGTIGGAGFYLAQQLRDPYSPRWLDLPAFLIMALAAASIPLILDASLVVRTRLLRRQIVQAPAPVPPSIEPPTPPPAVPQGAAQSSTAAPWPSPSKGLDSSRAPRAAE